MALAQDKIQALGDELFEAWKAAKQLAPLTEREPSIWLANKLGGFGIALKAGEVILSGSLSIMFPIQPGDSLRMRLGGIGSVSCRFA